ncbi:MAG: hypothetical protein ACYTGL_01380 [Planctomycetota bacterium]|jgi:hypothetical protein
MQCLNRRNLLTALFALYLVCSASARTIQAGEWADYRQVGRFFVRSEFPIAQQPGLADFLRDLGEHEADIVATLGLDRSGELIVISLLESRRSFVDAMRSVAPEAIRQRAVYVRADDAGHVYCYLHRDLIVDLRHELTHAILHSMLPFLPIWLDEGLAEYFEVPPEQRASGHPSQKRVVLAAKIGLTWRPGLTRLEAKDSLNEIRLSHYREAWAWVHFLLHGPPEVTRLLQRYLLTIQAEQPPGPLSTHLRQILPNPERALTEHLKSWK